ncbi:MAG: FAD-binding protein, partial [Acetobacteraceae bacterium]|nr:FAD-binding protein [Acetobacteraceae bacterium]
MSAAAVIAPADEAAVAAAVAAAHAAREPLAIEGNGSKRALLRPVQAARTLSLRNLSGITLYRPQELVLSARAGTPVPDIEAALAEHGQHLIAEPPEPGPLFATDRPATLGGVVAANLSGPRRITAGAMRDHVLGIRAVNGTGAVFRSGGRVLKNVTGLDLCKLLTGAHGTLGVLTEITLKVLPAPERTGTLALRVPDLAAGVAALSAGLGSPYGVSGAALLPAEAAARIGLEGPAALLRIEEFADSVAYRMARLAGDLAAHGPATTLDDAASRAAWRAVRDVGPLLGPVGEGEAVWRVSVRPG